METFVWLVIPFAVALVGFVLFWGIFRAVSNREEPPSTPQNGPNDPPLIEP